MEEEEMAERTRKERAEIVKKYDIGREEGAVIDPWEDPDFEVYTHTDRYGFTHDRPIPEVPSEIAAKARYLEVERTDKWLKMINSWDKYINSDKLSKRVYKGIPHAMRGAVWGRLLDVARIKQEQDGVYETMRLRSRLYSNDVRQIDLDVNRTYRNHVMFRERYGVKQQSLFHVLAAYSMYNTEVGYCQGMSQIGALLLMYLNTEEDAFWALSVLMSGRTHAMHGFFIPGFPKLKRFNEHHDKLLKKLLPKIKKVLDKHMIDVSLYTMKWYFQCFLDRAPFSLCLRLWDAYILDGERVLVAMGYLLMKLHKKSLLKGQFEDVMRLLNDQLVKDFGYEDDIVMAQLQGTMEDLRRSKLDLPPKAKANETPAMPFGLFTEPALTSDTSLTVTTKDDEKEAQRNSLSVPDSGTTSPSTPQPLEREESESRTPSPAYQGSAKAVNSLSGRSPSFPTDVSHEASSSSLLTASNGKPRFFQHHQQQQQQYQLRADVTSLASASDFDESRMSKPPPIEHHSRSPSSGAAAAAAPAAAVAQSKFSSPSPQSPDAGSVKPTPNSVAPYGGRDISPSRRGSEYDNDSVTNQSSEMDGDRLIRDSINGEFAQAPTYEGELEMNLERRTTATGSPWEDGFSRDFEASPLHVGKKSPPVIISPAKDRRLTPGGASGGSFQSSAPPLKGTPIPIIRETHILTTDPPGRNAMTTSMIPDSFSAIPIVEDVFREQVTASSSSSSSQSHSQIQQYPSLHQVHPSLLHDQSRQFDDENPHNHFSSQQQQHQQNQEPPHNHYSSLSQKRLSSSSSTSESHYHYHSSSSGHQIQSSSSKSKQMQSSSSSSSSRVPNERHIAVAEASTVNPSQGSERGATVSNLAGDDDFQSLVPPQKITYGEWKVSTMKKTSPNHSSSSPGVKGGGGGSGGSQVDETIDYSFMTDSASMRKKSKLKSGEKQKASSPENTGGGGRGDNHFFNGQSESARSSISSNQRSPLPHPSRPVSTSDVDSTTPPISSCTTPSIPSYVIPTTDLSDEVTNAGPDVATPTSATVTSTANPSTLIPVQRVAVCSSVITVTPAPTEIPITPAPTEIPITPAPTVIPITPAPTMIPITPAPTVIPITPAPTVIPIILSDYSNSSGDVLRSVSAPPPRSAPISAPTPAPTPTPTPSPTPPAPHHYAAPSPAPPSSAPSSTPLPPSSPALLPPSRVPSSRSLPPPPLPPSQRSSCNEYDSEKDGSVASSVVGGDDEMTSFDSLPPTRPPPLANINNKQENTRDVSLEMNLSSYAATSTNSNGASLSTSSPVPPPPSSAGFASPALPPSRIPVIDRSLKKTSSIEKRSSAISEEGSRVHHHHFHHQGTSGRVPPKIPWSNGANSPTSSLTRSPSSSFSHLPPIAPVGHTTPTSSSSTKGVRVPPGRASAIPPPTQIPRGPSSSSVVSKSPSLDTFRGGGGGGGLGWVAGGHGGSRSSLQDRGFNNNEYYDGNSMGSRGASGRGGGGGGHGARTGVPPMHSDSKRRARVDKPTHNRGVGFMNERGQGSYSPNDQGQSSYSLNDQGQSLLYSPSTPTNTAGISPSSSSLTPKADTKTKCSAQMHAYI